MNQSPQWDALDQAGKVERSIALMSSPVFVGKGSRASGEDALLLKIEHEPELVAEIIAAPGGHEAIVSLIKALYRSQNAGHSSQAAQRACRLFVDAINPEDQQEIRDAELDCRAFAVGTLAIGDDWLDDLTETEKIEVENRAKRFALYK
jgi:hypothetical protein